MGIIIGILVIGTALLMPILALIDIVKNTFDKESTKIVWAIIVLAMPIVGSILYFLIGVNQRVKA